MWKAEDRKSIIAYSKESRDDAVDKIFDNVVKLCKSKDKNMLETRAEKLDFIEENLYKISSKDSLIIHNIVDDEKKYDVVFNKMYDVLLAILNELLANMEKDAINDIVCFKEITRDQILSEKCEQIVMTNSDKILEAGFASNLKVFTKYRTNDKHKHMIILKKMCKKLGYDLVSRQMYKQSGQTKKLIREYFIKKT